MAKKGNKGNKGMKKGGMMMKKAGTPAPTSEPTSAPSSKPSSEPSSEPSSVPTAAPTPSTTIAEFIMSEPDLSIIFLALQRVNNVTLTQEDLEVIFGDSIPSFIFDDVPSPTFPSRKLVFDQNNALQRGNIVKILGESGNFTFFAPTNNALRAIGEDFLTKLFSESFKPHREDFVLYHGFRGERFTPNFVNSKKAKFVNNQRISTFNTENILVTTDPVVRINGEITLFQANNAASNGVTHKIRGVLAPDWVKNSIFGFVASMSDLSILRELLVLSGLDERLDTFDTMQFVPTLVAPTNAAFAALDPTFLNSLRLPANQGTLRRILGYHVIAGVLTLDKLAKQTSFATLEIFDNVRTSIVGGRIKFDQAFVIGPDIILANNGALYKIDAVLNPSNGAGF
jgi:uncharacterized surface protein with fasciclin (FAS1) repeats